LYDSISLKFTSLPQINRKRDIEISVELRDALIQSVQGFLSIVLLLFVCLHL